MSDDDELDPETGLWRPGRRTFVFMLGGALAGTVLGSAAPDFDISYLDENAPEIYPGVGLFDVTSFMKHVYGKGWYMSRDGKTRIYRADHAKESRARARAEMRGSRIILPKDYR